MHLKGPRLELRCGGRTVADLPGYEYEGNDERFTVRARLPRGTEHEPLLESARDCRLAVGSHTWRWKSVTVERIGDEVLVQGAGAPEVT